MAISFEYTQEQRNNQVARFEKIFGLANLAMKISQDGWSMEQAGDSAVLKVELVTIISMDEANKLINAVPIEEGT